MLFEETGEIYTHTECTHIDTGHRPWILMYGREVLYLLAIPSSIFCSEIKAFQAQAGLELANVLPQSVVARISGSTRPG